jgi:hypothetical protein
LVHDNMSRPKMPPQIFRLVLLTLAIIVTYVIARYLLTPPSFGQYGFYPGDALVDHMDPVSHPPVFAGRKECLECHQDVQDKLFKDKHKTIGCETCHGVGQEHAEDPNLKLVKIGDNGCLRCHENNGARPAWMKQIVVKDHYRGDKCAGCHVPHQPNEVP